MDYFQIAGVTISVTWDNAAGAMRRYGYHDCIILPRSLAAFRYDGPLDTPDMAVRVRSLRKYTGPAKPQKIYDQSFYQSDGQMFLTVYDPNNLRLPGYSIVMSKDYSAVDFIPHINEYEHYDLQWVMFPFEGRMLQKGGIVLHGAAVEYNGKGMIFTGVSGSGKSTQAHLWQKYRNALIINGDCPVLKADGGTTKIYGTPWCGSSGEAVNRNVPLQAVVLVRQGENNSLRELRGNDAFLALLANVFHSNFDTNSVDVSIENLQTLIGSVRVFELTCTISEESVKIVEKEIFIS